MGRRGKKRLSPKRRRNAAIRRQGRDPQLAAGVVTGQTTTQAQPFARPQPEGREGGSVDAPEPDVSGAIPEAPVETPIFDRLEKARSDAAMVRRAIRHRWQPDPRVTQAILSKAATIALDDRTSPPVFNAMAKLQFEAERQVTSDEHHHQRMDYYERALSLKAGVRVPETIGGAPPPGTAVTVDTSGPSRISIYIPDNGRDPVAEMETIERLEPRDDQ